MNRLLGLDREFYLATHGPQISALTDRADQLLDGRLPRLKAVATPGQPARLIDGHLDIATVEQRLALDGVDTGVLGADYLAGHAERLDTAHAQVADTMIRSTVELTELGRSVSTAGMFLRQRGLAHHIPPLTYQYATWAQASLRVAGGFLVVCSATHLEGDSPDLNNSNYHFSVDDNVTNQSLAVVKTDGDLFSINFDVESGQDALYRRCQDMLGSEVARKLLSGTGETTSEVAEQVSAFLKEQRDQEAPWLRSASAAAFVRSIHERVLTVRRTREKLAMHVDLPNRAALNGLSRLLGAPIVNSAL